MFNIGCACCKPSLPRTPAQYILPLLQIHKYTRQLYEFSSTHCSNLSINSIFLPLVLRPFAPSKSFR